MENINFLSVKINNLKNNRFKHGEMDFTCNNYKSYYNCKFNCKVDEKIIIFTIFDERKKLVFVANFDYINNQIIINENYIFEDNLSAKEMLINLLKEITRKIITEIKKG